MTHPVTSESSAPLAHPDVDPPRQKWLPIESAPKDGTHIDLWVTSPTPLFGDRWPNCFWGKPDHECGEAGEYCDSDWHTEKPGWVDGIFSEFLHGGNVTHWMPIPEAPSVIGGNVKGAPPITPESSSVPPAPKAETPKQIEFCPHCHVKLVEHSCPNCGEDFFETPPDAPSYRVEHVLQNALREALPLLEIVRDYEPGEPGGACAPNRARVLCEHIEALLAGRGPVNHLADQVKDSQRLDWLNKHGLDWLCETPFRADIRGWIDAAIASSPSTAVGENKLEIQL